MRHAIQQKVWFAWHARVAILACSITVTSWTWLQSQCHEARHYSTWTWFQSQCHEAMHSSAAHHTPCMWCCHSRGTRLYPRRSKDCCKAERYELSGARAAAISHSTATNTALASHTTSQRFMLICRCQAGVQ